MLNFQPKRYFAYHHFKVCVSTYLRNNNILDVYYEERYSQRGDTRMLDLDSAFTWSSSQQGTHFWNMHHDRYYEKAMMISNNILEKYNLTYKDDGTICYKR